MPSKPTHTRGSAAEQGAALRAQLAKQQGQSAPSEKPAAHAAPREKPAAKSRPVSQAPVESEKPKLAVAPAARQQSDDHQTLAAAHEPKTEKSGSSAAPNLDKKGRVYPLTGIDNLALLMENDRYSTVCYSMYLFRTALDDDTIYRFFERLATSYPKFGYRVELDPRRAGREEKARRSAERKGEAPPKRNITEEDRRGRRTRFSHSIKAGSLFRPARWVYADDFHVRDNIEIVEQCPDGGDEAALFAVAGKFLSRHFDYSKPLWEALAVRGLNTAEGAQSALIVKVHHAVSDGQGMIMSYHTALGSLASDRPVADIQAQFDRKTNSGEQKKPGQRNIKPTLWGTTKHGFHTARGLWTRPRKAFEYPEKPRAPGRLYHHSEGITMDNIKLVRKAFSNPDKQLNLSLNDVACAILSRALRLAAERTENGPIKDKRTAIFVPISKRPPGNWELSNFTTGAIAWFAFHDPKDVPFEKQLEQVNREMGRIKRSHWPNIWYTSFGWVSKHRALFLPNWLGWQWFFERTYREYSVATNVPGPPKPVKFGEHEAFSYHVLPPSSPGKSTLSIGMISYADEFSLAVSCDDVPSLQRLPREICKAFQDAAAELVEASKAKLAAEK